VRTLMTALFGLLLFEATCDAQPLPGKAVDPNNPDIREVDGRLWFYASPTQRYQIAKSTVADAEQLPVPRKMPACTNVGCQCDDCDCCPCRCVGIDGQYFGPGAANVPHESMYERDLGQKYTAMKPKTEPNIHGRRRGPIRRFVGWLFR
jgi:hypothetical protein